MEFHVDEGVLAPAILCTQADLDISPPEPLTTYLGDCTLDLELDFITEANPSGVTEINDGIESVPEVNIKDVDSVDVSKEVNVVKKHSTDTKQFESQVDVITGGSRSTSFNMNSDIEENAICTNQINKSVIPVGNIMDTGQASKNVSNAGVNIELDEHPESHLPNASHEEINLPTVQSYTRNASEKTRNKGPKCILSMVKLKQTRIKQYAITLDETNAGTVLQNDSNETVEFALKEGFKTTMILVGPRSTKMVLKENSGISESQAKSFPLVGNNLPLNSASVIPAAIQPCSEPIAEQSSISIVHPKADQCGDSFTKRQLQQQKSTTCPISQDSQPKLSVSLRSLSQNTVKKTINCPSEFVLSSAVSLPVTPVRQVNLSQETLQHDPRIQGNDDMMPASLSSEGNCKQIPPVIDQNKGSTNRPPCTQKVGNVSGSVLVNNGMFDISIIKMIDTKAEDNPFVVIKKVVNPDNVSLSNSIRTSKENISVYVGHAHTSKSSDGNHPTGVHSDQPPSMDNFQPTIVNNRASTGVNNIVPTDVNNSVPTDVNNSVPKDMNSSVPVNVNNNVLTNVSNSVPTDVSNSIPTDVNNSVPTNVNNSVPTDVNNSDSRDVTNSVPTDVNNSVPTDVNNSVSRDVANSVSTDVNNSVPTDVNNSVSRDVTDSIPTNVNNSLPTDVNNSVPTDVNNSVPTDVNNSVSTDVNSVLTEVNKSACGSTGLSVGGITCKDIETNLLLKNMKIISSSVYKIDVTAAAAYTILKSPIDRVQVSEKIGDNAGISSKSLTNMVKTACQNIISDHSTYCASNSNIKKKQTKGKPGPKKNCAKNGKPKSTQNVQEKDGEKELEADGDENCVQEKDGEVEMKEEDDYEIFLNSSSSDDELFDVNSFSNKNDPDFMPFSDEDSDGKAVDKSVSESSEDDSECNMEEIIDELKKEDPTLTKQYLEEHKEKYRLITLRKNGRYECLLCPESDYFKTMCRRSMAQHISLHISGDLSCEQCDFVGVSVNAMKAHKEKHSYKPEFTCRVCGDGHFELTCLYAHLHTVHDMEKCMTYLCPMCNDTFHIPKLYISHCRVRHKAQTLVKCVDCSQYFVSNEKHQLHLDREQCYKNAFTCEYCGKRFSTNTDLSMHIRKVHEKVFKYFCNQCDYKSDKKQFLEMHLKTHTGEHDIKCTLCDFSCIRSMQLTSHMRTHTGEKPYKCDLCKYAAGWNVQLKSHRAHHFSPYQVMCDKCEIVYDNKQGLHRHNKKVHSEDIVEENSKESRNVSKEKQKKSKTAEKSDDKCLAKTSKRKINKPIKYQSDDDDTQSSGAKKKKQLKVNISKKTRGKH